MFVSLRRSLIRLSRWPRRLAALACLLLAAASAVAPASGRPAHAEPVTVGRQLQPGEVAVTVAVTSAPPTLGRGDRVGLVAGPDDSGAPARPRLLADRLRVLAVTDAAADTSDPPTVLLAADRDTAVRIAANTGRQTVVVVDRSP